MGTANTLCNKCLTYYPEGTEHVCDPTSVPPAALPLASALEPATPPVVAPTAPSAPPATTLAPIAESVSSASSDGSTAAYYEFPADAQELIDLIEHKAMGFNQGNIFKAAYRLGEKDGVSIIYDLNKIIYFANRMKVQAIKMGATS